MRLSDKPFALPLQCYLQRAGLGAPIGDIHHPLAHAVWLAICNQASIPVVYNARDAIVPEVVDQMKNNKQEVYHGG